MTDQDAQVAVARLRRSGLNRMLRDNFALGAVADDLAVVCDALEQAYEHVAALDEANIRNVVSAQAAEEALAEAQQEIAGHVRGNAKLCETAAKNLERAEQAEALAAELARALSCRNCQGRGQVAVPNNVTQGGGTIEINCQSCNGRRTMVKAAHTVMADPRVQALLKD